MSSDNRMPAAAQAVLDFWFGLPGAPEWNISRREWFTKCVNFDTTVRARFLSCWQAAHDGAEDDWSVTPEGACARIVLLDQFPRNMFRGDPRSFATDGKALAAARRMLDLGWDRQLPTSWHRMFCYLPFEHAESLDAQDIAVREMMALRDDGGGKADVVEWAEKHRDVIARFGRYPHRNAVLGRVNSDAEAAYLKQPGSSF
ncbi:MAG: hypothetical protein COC14_11165 [Burkholderiaceae bacterium]|jgi:uncharacterized protein (DUF924 family)|uniref:DUF924 domain-containing protein n=1 Tax=Cupriavidus metallidurans TaxID=119219 RepID=A0A132HKZ3_9BURK|nr:MULTISPECIES: DUF924 family protein [Cupriavidus]KWW36596.1 hypothetical protein AU374_02655 [Cupriavidus metallidurans]PCH54623.1 MAG: hypothetical protein COC14_11165 [Burkholderiaceae bacterium]QBP09070.1 DUF924 domain-containing protein [Cupriavidus metallidurans]QWC89500.1 DUF924 domain-containing protein [Cupriavidus metallidurans]